jgi:transposase
VPDWRWVSTNHEREGAQTNVKRIGVDLAKSVFELYGMDESEQRVLSKTMRRGQLLSTFAQLPPCLVGMEACGSAHS